jgi:drug/metabolite transporter (DMT)-like permease
VKKGYVYIIISAFLFSTMEIVSKGIAKDINPIQLNFIRFLIGALILLPSALKNLKIREISLNKDDFKFFILTGFVGVAISMTFFQVSILYTKASTVAILFSCNPIFVIPLAHFLLKEKLSKETIMSLCVSIVGILFIMNPFKISSDIYGISYVIIAAMAFALYSVIGKKRSARYGAVILSSFSFLMGSIELLVLILLTKIDFISNWTSGLGLSVLSNIPIILGITYENILAVAYMGIFVTGLGYLFYFMAMEETSASTASLVFFIKPALAPILAFLLINENIALNSIAGIILIVLGSSIVFISNNKKLKIMGDDVMAYSIGITKKEEQNTSNWSGGTTTQLAIYPDDAVYSECNFKWRISSAKVNVGESTFTNLPGISRVIMIVDGKLKLEHEGHHKVELNPFEQDSFSGEWNTKSYGKVTDFNLMMNSECEGSLEAILLGEKECTNIILENNKEGFDNISDALYCVNGEGRVLVNNKKINVLKGDFVLIDRNCDDESTSLEIFNDNDEQLQIIKTNVYY